MRGQLSSETATLKGVVSAPSAATRTDVVPDSPTAQPTRHGAIATARSI